MEAGSGALVTSSAYDAALRRRGSLNSTTDLVATLDRAARFGALGTSALLERLAAVTWATNGSPGEWRFPVGGEES